VSLKDALMEHEIRWHALHCGGVLPADRLDHGRAVIRGAAAGLRVDAGGDQPINAAAAPTAAAGRSLIFSRAAIVLGQSAGTRSACGLSLSRVLCDVRRSWGEQTRLMEKLAQSSEARKWLCCI
jgi:hypothetical protein